MSRWSWHMLHNFLNPLKQATASLSGPQPPHLLLGGPKCGTSSSQPRFTVWLCLGISKPCTSSSHLRLLYNSCRVAPERIQVGDDIGLYYLKPQSLSTQWTATDHGGAPPPCPCTADPLQRAEVGGHSQSLKLTGLRKSLPLTCQQQSGSTTTGGCTQSIQREHLKCAGLDDREGCATGPYKIPAILGHTTKTGSHSSST